MQDNRRTAAAKEFLCIDLSVAWERTKTSYVVRVECLPRAGPMGDIFSAVLIHYTEDLLPHPQQPTGPHFFFSICLSRCEAGTGLSLSLSFFSSPFLCGGRTFLIQVTRVHNFGSVCMETLLDPWLNFRSRLKCSPSVLTLKLSSLNLIFGLIFIHLVVLLCAISLCC